MEVSAVKSLIIPTIMVGVLAFYFNLKVFIKRVKTSDSDSAAAYFIILVCIVIAIILQIHSFIKLNKKRK